VGEESLYLALNAADYTDTGMRFRHYEQPSVFVRSREAADVAHCDTSFDVRCATGLHPTGGVNEGGTSVTLFGAGLAAFTSDAQLASCRWGETDAGITTPTAVEGTRIVCPTPARELAATGDEAVALRVALNGVHFVHTSHTYTYYQQPLNFSSVSPKGGPVRGLT
jgi:hypothetical protein